ncbi:hypothetical protein PAYE108092_21000 [Paracoccus yeei]
MAGIDPALVLAFQHRVAGDQCAILEDPDLGRVVLDLDDAPPGGVGNAVLVAAHGDHAFLADPPLDGQNRLIGTGRQGQQLGAFFLKMRVHDLLGRGMQTGIGDGQAPFIELGVQIVEILEAAAEEEVLPHIAEGPLDLALGFGPVGLAGPGRRIVMPQQGHQGRVVGHHPRSIFADDGGLHPIIEYLATDPAHGVECGDVAAHHRFQRLVRAEPSPEPAAVPEHHAEQPDLAQDARLDGEFHLELGKIDLRLLARRRLEAPLELPWGGGPDQPQIFRQRGIGALIAHRPDLSMQPARRETRKGLDSFGKIGPELLRQSFTPGARAIDRRLEPLGEILPDRLAIEPGLSRNRADSKPLPPQLQDHHNLPQSNHLRAFPMASAGGILRFR